MKMSKRNKILCVGIAIILLILGWRLWPRSFNQVISLDPADVEDFYCICSVSNFDQDSEADIEFYELQSLIEDDKDFKEVIKILNDNKYRSDFRNLLPGKLESVRADRNYDGKSVLIKFVWGENGSEQYSLNYFSGSLISIGDDTNGGFKIYHPTDRNALDKLVEYIQKHGVKK